ncbi:hypothetical protein GCM10010497_15890 [Streptomyces cinereoruber]|uniref:Uncharacterized protein n=1 Tax=Streptomyces cinereoruber TaxID=67260 RepID=A0AAV4KG15_9ACTN|nr:hypothetical protein GCM10010497_15890 [Streptomyces cinereoruber]
MGRGEEREAGVQAAPGDAIEVVSVQVREDDGVQGGQCVDLARRVAQTPAHQAVPQVGVLALVQEVGVGQQGRPAVPQEEGGVADELDLETVRAGRAHAGLLVGALVSPPYAIARVRGFHTVVRESGAQAAG